MTQKSSEPPHSGLLGSLMVFIAAVGFSSKAIMVKLAYVYPVDAATLIALRMAFSAPFFIALAIWVARSGKTPNMTTQDGWMIAALGFLGGYGPMWLDFAGLSYVTASLERIILFLYPTMVVLMSALAFKKRIHGREIFALLTSYAGVALVVGHDLTILKSGASQTLLGAALVMASAISYAAYLVCSGRLIPKVGAPAFTAYTMLTATLASGLHFAVTTHPVAILHLPRQVYALSLLMAVIATVLPAILLNAGIQRIGSNKASLVSSVGPVSTIFLAYIFLQEDITWLQLAGTGLVMTGVLAISLHKVK